MKYTLEIKSTAVRELELPPKRIFTRAIRSIDELAIQPRPHGSKKMAGVPDRWRVRIGDYRILYLIDDRRRKVTVFRVLHRKEAYRY